MSKIFLGGTCNNSTWREDLIPLLKIDYFNPVVEDWTPSCIVEEDRQKDLCDYHLYTITPLRVGDYSIAEVIESAIITPHKTIFCVLKTDGGQTFTEGQLRSLDAIGNRVVFHGGVYFKSLEDVAKHSVQRLGTRI